MKRVFALLVLTLSIGFAVTPASAQGTPPEPGPTSPPRMPDNLAPPQGPGHTSPPRMRHNVPPPGPGPNSPPRIPHDLMFPPEMIMQHQRELGLTDQQKTYLRAEIGKTSTRFNDLQWQLQDAMEALGETMKVTPINEQQALAQLDHVLDAEREIKRLHMELAIKIKNNLTLEQQQKLQKKLQNMRGRIDEPGMLNRP